MKDYLPGLGLSARLTIYPLEFEEIEKGISSMREEGEHFVSEFPNYSKGIGEMLTHYNSFAGDYRWNTEKFFLKKIRNPKNVTPHFTGKLILPRLWEEFCDLHKEDEALLDISTEYKNGKKSLNAITYLNGEESEIRTKIKRGRSWPSFCPDIFKLENVNLSAKPREFVIELG